MKKLCITLSLILIYLLAAPFALGASRANVEVHVVAIPLRSATRSIIKPVVIAIFTGQHRPSTQHDCAEYQ